MAEIDYESHKIYKKLEDPIPILFWEPLEFIFALGFFGIGIVFDSVVFGGSGGVLVLWGAKYMRRGAKKGATQHALWGAGIKIDPALTTKFPAPWQKDFME